MKYPFVVNGNKAVVVEGASLENAVDRVLLKHPNKFITTTFARNLERHKLTNHTNMDLIGAQADAKKLSKLKKNELVYIVLETDEFHVREGKDVNVDKDDIYSTWRGGSKIDSPHEAKAMEAAEQKTNKVKTENNKPMSTTKKTAAKKVAKPSTEKRKITLPLKKVIAKKLGASCFFDAAEVKALDVVLKKEACSFNAWVNKIVFAKLK